MKLHATNNDLMIKESERLISGSVNMYTCEFTFDESWDGYTVTAVFSTGNRLVNMAVVDGKCDIPVEVLRPNARIRIGIFGVDGDRSRPTTYSDWIIVEQGADMTGNAGQPPTPSVYEQWMNVLDEKNDAWEDNEQARVEAENARIEAENARIEAEQAREDLETGYVAQATEQADLAKQWAEAAATAAGGGVASFNGRGGHVLPQSGDYTAEQVGARPATWMPTAADVGARPATWMPTAADVGARPATWMPTAADVGARPNTWMPTAADVGADPVLQSEIYWYVSATKGNDETGDGSSEKPFRELSTAISKLPKNLGGKKVTIRVYGGEYESPVGINGFYHSGTSRSDETIYILGSNNDRPHFKNGISIVGTEVPVQLRFLHISGSRYESANLYLRRNARINVNFCTFDDETATGVCVDNCGYVNIYISEFSNKTARAIYSVMTTTFIQGISGSNNAVGIQCGDSTKGDTGFVIAYDISKLLAETHINRVRGAKVFVDGKDTMYGDNTVLHTGNVVASATDITAGSSAGWQQYLVYE